MLPARRTPGRLALLAALGAAVPAAAQTVAPGGSALRNVGPLFVTATVDTAGPRVRVTLALAGHRVGQALLAPESPEYRFDVRTGDASASGTLSLRRAPAPGLSSVQGDVAVRGGGGPPAAFQGSLATWAWPETLPRIERRTWLSPEISVRTVVRGEAGTAATITLYTGQEVMGELAVTQASPVAVVPDDLVLGDARVSAGTTFTLTIPTPLQQGQVFMRGQYRTRNTPDTAIAAAVAVWTQ